MDSLIYQEDTEVTPACFFTPKEEIFNQTNIFPKKNKQLKNGICTIFQKKEDQTLKKLIKKQKVNNLVENYCKKLKVNITNRVPLELNIQNVEKQTMLDKLIDQKEGYEFSVFQTSFCNLINIFITILLCLYFSTALVFDQIGQHTIFIYLEVTAIICYTISMVLNCIKKKYRKGKQLIKIKQIVQNYVKQQFGQDLMIILILILDVVLKDQYQLRIIRIVTMIKLSNVYLKIKQIENIYITTTLRQQYWGLVTVFIINFSFAHILAISLNAMAFLDTNNWLVKMNLTHVVWYEKYIWGYYWGTTTMLTVGYGDFSATNYKQAVCLVFIEMISCITLSYNINYVGNLVNSIRQQSIDKNKSLKIFQQMSSKNRISNELESRVKNYIEKSYQIRKEFNFAEEDKVLDSLPENIKRDYLKETNIKMFKQMTFLKSLTTRTQALLASKLKRQIMHPEQIIQRKEEEQKLFILNQGEIGFRSKGSTNSKKDAIIENLVVNETSPQPKLISLGFITTIKLSYQIRSLSYSVLFYIEKEDLIEVLKNYNLDYERYCQFRDTAQLSVNQIELYHCQFCKNEYHSKFNCSRLHYIPIRQQVVFKYLHKIKIDRQNRIPVNRKAKSAYSTLKYNFQITKITKSFLKIIQIDESLVKTLEQKNSSETSEVIPSDQLKNSNFIKFHTTTLTHKYLKLPMSDLKTHFHQQKNEIAQLIKQINIKHQNFWMIETDNIYHWKFYRKSDNLKSKDLKARKSKTK